MYSENECIMELFKGQSLLEFTERFKTEVSEFNIDRYLAEYSFRINHSQSKDTIFNKLIKRLIERKPIFQSQLVCP